MVKSLLRRLLQKRYEHGIAAQRATVAIVYDHIMDRVPVERIREMVQAKHISPEIGSILRALQQVGYLSAPPLSARPTLSVVIPHYNQTRRLPETLESLVRQTYRPDEVIVVDDQSDTFPDV